MIWLTSDTHFNHVNILRYCNRPFGSVEEMNEALIRNWNERVDPEDTVYFLGDFAFGPRGEHESFFLRLNGRKHLIQGNHDGASILRLPWLSQQHYLELKVADIYAVLCHYPMEDWNDRYHQSCMFHGHSHGTGRVIHRRLDVGVDNCDYAPIGLEQAAERAFLHPRR